MGGITKDDVISLLDKLTVGNDYYSTGGYNSKFLSECEFKVEVNSDTTWYFIFKKDGKITIEENEDELFCGIINDKLELKNILIELNIINE